MDYRCPAAKVVTTATLPDYSLTFNGKANGTGVANIYRRDGAKVEGLLWEITERCEQSLDRYEGFPTLYEKHTVTVYKKDGVPVEAMVYIMTKEYNKVALPAWHYYASIVAGYKENDIDVKPLHAVVGEIKERRKRGEINGNGKTQKADGKPKAV